MFAEELAGNASRKRAEENRARRRRLKAQQEKKNQQQQQASSTAAASGASTPLSKDSQATPNGVAFAASDTAVVATTSTTGVITTETARISSMPAALATPTQKVVATSKSQLSAVEKAQQQRHIRAQAALQQKSAVKLQACYRRHRSMKHVLQQENESLTKSVNDLGMLRTVLQQTKQVEYVPPPATTTALVQQLLFVAGRESNSSTSSSIGVLTEQILRHALLPAVGNADATINPLLVWLETRQGKRRLENLLRLILETAVAKNAGIDNTRTMTQFLVLVLGGGEDDGTPSVPKTIVAFCRFLLLPRTIPSIPQATNSSPLASTLSLVAIVRYFLLFVVAGPNPIPPNAVDTRDKCISASSKEQGGELLLLVLKATEASPSPSDKQTLYSQVFVSLMTVPLLTWKISDVVATYLTSRSSNSSGKQGNIPFIQVLESFCALHAGALSHGQLETLLNHTDIPLQVCPAIATQCLLSNLVQLGRLCPSCNGMDANQMDFDVAAIYFNMISVILDVVPLGTFSSRESAIEWIDDDKGNSKPVVLSPVILDQCRYLLVDSFVRKLFLCAIDTEALNTEEVLAEKDDKDLAHEKDLQEAGASSAAALAAREARVDRSRMFWNSSKWARKLTKGVSNLLSAPDSSKGSSHRDSGDGKSGLINTSSMSREIAEGRKFTPQTDTKDVSSAPIKKKYSTQFLCALARAYSIVLARWGGGGGLDVVLRKPSNRLRGEREFATASAEPCAVSLLNTLSFGTPLVKVLWALIQSDTAAVLDIYNVIDANKGKVPVRALTITPQFVSKKKNDGPVLLFLFVALFSHVLILADDVEIHDMDRPIPIHQIRRCIQVLKKLLYRACCIDDTTTKHGSTYFGLAMVAASSRTLRDLYDRSSRRPLCVPKLWIVSDLLEKDVRSCKSHGDYVALLSNPVLRVCPFLVSFKRRLKIFERIVTTCRIEIQGVNDANPFNNNPLKPGIPVRITRGRILEDGLLTMNNLGTNMRQRIAVQYYNEAGTRETGIDAGGLFKEFWTDLCAIAFDPNYALFRVTDGGSYMYPNPSSSAAHGSDHTILFAFLGRILGKALFEGITIRPMFAHFFLSFLRGDYNYLHMLPDLSTVDSQLYNNLMFLKTYDGDASDLCLTFTVTNDDFGGTTEIPLMPNGANVEVTNVNKHRYISLVSKYYVVDRVKEQSEAFTRGLWEVIDRSWLRIFNEPELQVLISGASDGKLDVDDMRANTRYVGGFTGLDRTVNRFWNVVQRMDGKQQADLLRFVTSCERPPPLGFASMNPPFTLQRVFVLRDGEKLPTASTCFNTLKLPTYSNEKVMKERLLYAIQAGAGFELS